MKTFLCPNCGGEVPVKKKACPFCGSDKNTGWSENTYLDGIGLYDDDDYQETIKREFGVPKGRNMWKNLSMALVAVILLVIFLMRYIFHC